MVTGFEDDQSGLLPLVNHKTLQGYLKTFPNAVAVRLAVGGVTTLKEPARPATGGKGPLPDGRTLALLGQHRALTHIFMGTPGQITKKKVDTIPSLDITDAGLASLAPLKGKLQHVDLCRCDKVTPAGLAHLAGVSCVTLAHCALGQRRSADDQEAAADAKYVEAEHALDGSRLAGLVGLCHLKLIGELPIVNSDFKPNGQGLRSLTIIHVVGGNWSLGGEDSLDDQCLLHCTALESLHIGNGNYFTGECAGPWAAAKDSLRHLRLKGLGWVPVLAQYSRLETLWMDG